MRKDVKQFDVLICGKIRDPARFAGDLEIYRLWQAKRYVRHIVYSGWHSELKSNSDILDQMCANGIRVVLAAEPTFTVTSHVFHQLQNIADGLNELEPDAIVLKSRTDKIWLGMDPEVMAEEFFAEPDLPSRCVFDRRIKLPAGLALKPFFFNDTIFMGRASDIRRLVSFDMWFEFQRTAINAEQVIHTAPRRIGHPEIDAFFRASPGLIYQNRELARAVDEIMFHDPLFQRVMYESLTVLRDEYTIGMNRAKSKFKKENFDGLTLLEINQNAEAGQLDGMSYTEIAHEANIEREEVISVLLDMPVSSKEPRSLAELAQSSGVLSAADCLRESDILASKLRVLAPELNNVFVPPSMEAGKKILWQRRSHIVSCT